MKLVAARKAHIARNSSNYADRIIYHLTKHIISYIGFINNAIKFNQNNRNIVEYVNHPSSKFDIISLKSKITGKKKYI